MNLTIDIGNSRTKVALFDGEEMTHFEAVQEMTPTYIKALLKQHRPVKAIVSAVADHFTELESQLSAQLEQVITFDQETPIPVRNNYQRPDTLGKDRLAAIVGAARLIPGHDVLVIDAGTCITFDFLHNTNQYLGGSITPGIAMRFKALNHFTGRLPQLDGYYSPVLIGSHTAESIKSGVLRGVLAEVQGMIANYRSIYPAVKVVLTGGDSRFFESNLKSKIFAQPKLVLYGLNQILRYNVRSD